MSKPAVLASRAISTPRVRRTVIEATTSPRASFSLTGLRTTSLAFTPASPLPRERDHALERLQKHQRIGRKDQPLHAALDQPPAVIALLPVADGGDDKFRLLPARRHHAVERFAHRRMLEIGARRADRNRQIVRSDEEAVDAGHRRNRLKILDRRMVL